MRASSASLSSGCFCFAPKLQLNTKPNRLSTNSEVRNSTEARIHQMTNWEIRTSSFAETTQAPRKERVLPVLDPAIAASREAQAVAASSNGGAECWWQVETVFGRWAAGSTRLRALGMAAAGDGSTPVRRESLLRRPRGEKRTVNVCTSRRLNHSGELTP
jgi:hypothetical protein